LMWDIDDLAAHRSPQLRSAAGWLLTHGKAVAADSLRSLARDADRSVRLTVAYGLRSLRERDQNLASEIHALLMHDESAMVRGVAARTGGSEVGP
jgi:hypothetical protein